MFQHTSDNFQIVHKKYDAISSASRKGMPHDNVLIKLFYMTIKRERIKGAK